MILSEVSENLTASIIRKVFNKSLEYEDVISFTLGEPDFTASEAVVEAGCQAMKEGKTKYSENAGIFSLRKAISEHLKKFSGLEYDPKTQISVTCGAMEALFLTFKSILNPNDEVIILSPNWPNYTQQVIMCGGKPIFVVCKEENDFVVDVNDLEALITPKTKAIMLNSPTNPTGCVIDFKTLSNIAEIANKYDLLILSDEVYKRIIFDDIDYYSIVNFPGMKDRTIIIDSLSKSHAMTGWRIGYAAGPEPIISLVTKLQENVAACAPMVSQYAAIAAYECTDDYTNFMVHQYKDRRDYIEKRIKKIPNVSYQGTKGTFYAFINISQLGMTSEDFVLKFLDSQKVITVPGTAFGKAGEGYIRISFAAAMESIIKGMDRLEAFVSEINNKNE